MCFILEALTPLCFISGRVTIRNARRIGWDSDLTACRSLYTQFVPVLQGLSFEGGTHVYWQDNR